MTLPLDANARLYYRVAMQRLDEAELILEKIDLPALAAYIAGYSVECILKALLFANTPASERLEFLRSLKSDIGHSFERLRAELKRRKISLPKNIVPLPAYVSSWSPE